MILKSRQADSFIANPDPGVRAALVYGPDAGLVSERVTALGRAVAGDLSDPFRVATLGAAELVRDPAQLQDEAQALSMMGGRRAVLVRGAGDALSGLFEDLFALPAVEALVVVEAGDLGPRSSLRQVFEAAKDAVAIPCYVDDAEAVEEIARDAIKNAGLRIDEPALADLVGRLGTDRLQTRRALEKLVFYKGKDRAPIDIADIAACVEDGSDVASEDIVYAAASGEAGALDAALRRATLEGFSPVQLLRVAAGHIARLHLAVGTAERGGDVERAMKSVRPPIFFKRQEAFRQQVRNWDTKRLSAALGLLTEAEERCKMSGMPDRTVCERALFAIAAASRSRRAR